LREKREAARRAGGYNRSTAQRLKRSLPDDLLGSVVSRLESARKA
jgi:hypothetical protein